MKKCVMVLMLSVIGVLPVQVASAQTVELTQLLLDIEKLAQLKQILTTMKQYYDILTKGYNAVRDIAKGNFSIHNVFLNGLLEVSPAVKKYGRIVDIVEIQLSLVKEYKAALKWTKASGLLNAGELDYLERVYSQLIDQSLENLGDLTQVIKAKQLRMSDEERLAAIAGIFSDMSTKLEFLRQFNNSNSVLLLQRSKEKSDAQALQKMLEVNE